MPISTLTYRYRVKDSTSGKHLQTMALAVPTVWNDCSEVSIQAWPRHRGWLRGFDLITLTAGSSELLRLLSSSQLGKTRLAKSVYEVGWHQLRAVAEI